MKNSKLYTKKKNIGTITKTKATQSHFEKFLYKRNWTSADLCVFKWIMHWMLGFCSVIVGKICIITSLSTRFQLYEFTSTVMLSENCVQMRNMRRLWVVVWDEVQIQHSLCILLSFGSLNQISVPKICQLLLLSSTELKTAMQNTVLSSETWLYTSLSLCLVYPLRIIK